MSHALTDLPEPIGAQAPAGLAAMLEAELAPLVEQIDEGLYPAGVMRRLGEVGVFSHHLSHGGPIDLPRAIADMATIAASCMSTAFCVWCQDACGWYLENTDNAALRARLQGGIADGTILGGTGLSNPIKALSKLEAFALQATRVEGGYIVNGVLPWVSNLGDGHWMGTIFQDADNPDHKMMAMLADPLGDMVARIRPGFVLLQTGMGLGIIRASIDGMHKANRSHGQTNSFLPKGPSALEDSLDAATAELMRLAATPRDGSADYVRAVLRARLRVGELTLEATQAGMLHAGAKAFITGSPVQRRLREGYFVAMITPSIRHLTQELSRMAAN
jgi:alkylation response protein AidB-like acyl-CoA dehydrogenase